MKFRHHLTKHLNIESEMPPITIYGRSWLPKASQDVPDADDAATSLYPRPPGDATNTRFIIIQVKDQQSWLGDHKVIIQCRVDSMTFLCKYEPDDLVLLRQQPFISHTDVYHNYWKFPSKLDVSSFGSSQRGFISVNCKQFPSLSNSMLA